MSDLTGSQNLGYGFSLAFDVNPTAETATIKLQFEGGTVGTWTLNSTSTTANINLSVSGYGVKGSVTANWSSDSITYSVKITFGPEKKNYSGTLVSW